MHTTRLTLLNTSIITAYGTYKYEPLTLEHARRIVAEFQSEGKEIQSAIGHQSTADLLTMLLNFPVNVNRIEFEQTPTDAALIFKLKGRVSEGKVLSREELETMGYEFGLLKRIV